MEGQECAKVDVLSGVKRSRPGKENKKASKKTSASKKRSKEEKVTKKKVKKRKAIKKRKAVRVNARLLGKLPDPLKERILSSLPFPCRPSTTETSRLCETCRKCPTQKACKFCSSCLQRMEQNITGDPFIDRFLPKLENCCFDNFERNKRCKVCLERGKTLRNKACPECSSRLQYTYLVDFAQNFDQNRCCRFPSNEFCPKSYRERVIKSIRYRMDVDGMGIVRDLPSKLQNRVLRFMSPYCEWCDNMTSATCSVTNCNVPVCSGSCVDFDNPDSPKCKECESQERCRLCGDDIEEGDEQLCEGKRCKNVVCFTCRYCTDCKPCDLWSMMHKIFCLGDAKVCDACGFRVCGVQSDGICLGCHEAKEEEEDEEEEEDDDDGSVGSDSYQDLIDLLMEHQQRKRQERHLFA